MRLTRADAAVVIVGNGYRSARRRLLGSGEHDREARCLPPNSHTCACARGVRLALRRARLVNNWQKMTSSCRSRYGENRAARGGVAKNREPPQKLRAIWESCNVRTSTRRLRPRNRDRTARFAHHICRSRYPSGLTHKILFSGDVYIASTEPTVSIRNFTIGH